MKSLHTLLRVAQRRMDELGVEAAKVQQEIDGAQAKQEAISGARAAGDRDGGGQFDVRLDAAGLPVMRVK